MGREAETVGEIVADVCGRYGITEINQVVFGQPDRHVDDYRAELEAICSAIYTAERLGLVERKGGSPPLRHRAHIGPDCTEACADLRALAERVEWLESVVGDLVPFELPAQPRVDQRLRDLERPPVGEMHAAPTGQALSDRLKVLESESAEWRMAYEREHDRLLSAQNANRLLREQINAKPAAPVEDVNSSRDLPGLPAGGE